MPSAIALGGHSRSTHAYRTTSHETPTTEVARGDPREPPARPTPSASVAIVRDVDGEERRRQIVEREAPRRELTVEVEGLHLVHDR